MFDTVGLASHIRHGNFGEVCLLDPEERVTPWNTGAERIKGYTA
jgi:hypothetical protein